MYEVSVYFLIFRLSSRGLEADRAMPGMLHVTGVLQNPADRWCVYATTSSQCRLELPFVLCRVLRGEQVLKLVKEYP